MHTYRRPPRSFFTSYFLLKEFNSAESWSMHPSIARPPQGDTISHRRWRKSKEIILTDGHPRRLHMKSVQLWIDTPLLCRSTCLSPALPVPSSRLGGKLGNIFDFRARKEAGRAGAPEGWPRRETICQIFTASHTMDPHLRHESPLSSLSNFLLESVLKDRLLLRTRKGSNRWLRGNCIASAPSSFLFLQHTLVLCFAALFRLFEKFDGSETVRWFLERFGILIPYRNLCGALITLFRCLFKLN